MVSEEEKLRMEFYPGLPSWKAGQWKAGRGRNPDETAIEISPGLPACYRQQSELTQDSSPPAARVQTLPSKLDLPGGL